MIIGVALLASALMAAGQGLPYPSPQNVLQLSANGTVEVQQDLLSLSLTTTREGAEANAVQGQLKAALDAALAEARKTAQPGQMDVRTGTLRALSALRPRRQDQRLERHRRTGPGGARFSAHHADGGQDPDADRGLGELRPEPRAARQGGRRSPGDRHRPIQGEGRRTGERLRLFRLQPARGVREFERPGVSATHAQHGARRRAMQAEMAVPVEAGKSTVLVTVSGSVQLR